MLKLDNNITSSQVNKVLNNHRAMPIPAGLHILFCQETKFTRYGKFLDDLISTYKINPKLTYFTCYNTFSKHSHRDNDILGLNALWLDFDTCNNSIPVTIFQSAIPYIYKLMELPKPNHVIMSGNGVHFVWFFSTPRVTHSKRFTDLWKLLEEQIIRLGQEACDNVFGCKRICDPSVNNPSRLMRIVGSYNNKYNEHILVRRLPEFESSKMYPLEYFVREYLPDYINKSENKQDTSHIKFKKWLKHHHSFSTHSRSTLNWCRYYDLKHLIILNKGKCTGCRDLILFFAECSLCRVATTKTMIKCAKYMNNLFDIPLPKQQVKDFINEIKHLNFEHYRLHTNRYIINALNITPEQQKQLLTLKPATKSTDQIHHRNHLKRKKMQRQYDKSVINKVHKLRQKGYTQTKVAKLLHTSRHTISRIFKRAN